MKSRLGALLAVLVLVLSAVPAHAARPLLDQHQWDRYFALFARDQYLPSEAVQVRLDTYSGAPVDLAVYAVDPADALIANGAAPRERPVDLSKVQAVARWRFTPPAGYRYTSNTVDVPLAGREGFFVIEARRGEAAQQVWLNVTSAGLLAKSGPGGLFIYAADLRSGRPLPHMRLTFVANGRFDTHYTDEDGIYRWTSRAHPIFVLGAWGKGEPFLSLLPQAPDPRSVLVVRLDRGTARAGESVEAAGFARVRKGAELMPAGGEVQLRIVGGSHADATARAKLDADGAFSASITLPGSIAAGEYSVLATAAGASGSAPLHVLPASDGISVAIDAPDAPGATAAVPISLEVQRNGRPLAEASVSVRVTRVPHAMPPAYQGDLEGGWGSSVVYARTLRSDAAGRATFSLPPPTDGLPSTYVVRARAGNAGERRVVVASAPDALEIVPERTRVAAGSPIRAVVHGYRVADGSPTAGRQVTVTLSHGVSTQQQVLRLDGAGEASVTFKTPYLGGNLIVARSNGVTDATGVLSEPQDLALTPASSSSSEIAIRSEREGDALRVDADLHGAAGSALITLQTSRVLDARVVSVRDGGAAARLSLKGVSDNATVGIAFVKAGSLVWRDAASPVAGELQVHIDSPAALAPGGVAELRIHVGSSAPATAVVRVSDQTVSAGSSFTEAVALLTSAGVTTQNTAPQDAVWHAWVTPAGSNVGDLFALQRTQIVTRRETEAPSPTRVYAWNTVRGTGGALTARLTAPPVRGRYALTVLVISADGRVGAGAANLEVQ